MEPLSGYDPMLGQNVALALGAAGAVVATALFELSRTLAEEFKGRWFAGNGRDLFHVGAFLALALPLLAMGLSWALAAFFGATIAVAPLVVLDKLPARRPTRVLLLLAVVTLGLAPPLFEPRSMTAAANALARALFH